MALLIELPLLIGLILFHARIRNALVCAAIWGAVQLLLAMFVSASITLALLLWGGAAFLLALGYFALLDHLAEKGWWWVVMSVGALILLGVP